LENYFLKFVFGKTFTGISPFGRMAYNLILFIKPLLLFNEDKPEVGLNCQDVELCTKTLDILTSDLENAKKRIFYLVNFIFNKM